MTGKIILERTFPGTLEQAWEFLSTKDGLESWWGPDGFETRVHQLDLRPGGAWRYSMTAVGAEQVAFMKNAKMPLSTESSAFFTEVTPLRRLGYRHAVDFIPGVEPYEITELIELHEDPRGVRMVVTIDAMHDDRWTGMSRMGWEQQLGRLGQLLKTS